MSQRHIYTEYHPRWHRKRTSTYWWMRQWRYLKFILRELSCLGVAYFVVTLLILLNSLRGGVAAYAEFQALMRSLPMIALSVIAFFLVLFHTITWFNLAPRAMVVYLGKKRVPDWLIAAPNYAAWLTVSAAIVWFLIGGKR
jgi:fumarate reductase subunit C